VLYISKLATLRAGRYAQGRWRRQRQVGREVLEVGVALGAIFDSEKILDKPHFNTTFHEDWTWPVTYLHTIVVTARFRNSLASPLTRTDSEIVHSCPIYFLSPVGKGKIHHLLDLLGRNGIPEISVPKLSPYDLWSGQSKVLFGLGEKTKSEDNTANHKVLSTLSLNA